MRRRTLQSGSASAPWARAFERVTGGYLRGSRDLGDVEDVRHGDRLLTAEEVAAMLRVTKAWVYAETRRGDLPHVRLGRYVRYREPALRRWIEASERGRAAARPTP